MYYEIFALFLETHASGDNKLVINLALAWPCGA